MLSHRFVEAKGIEYAADDLAPDADRRGGVAVGIASSEQARFRRGRDLTEISVNAR
jgi:hypothetical protein